MLHEGDKAPDFSLPETNGSILSLTKLRGKKVVLYFYPRDNTPGCTREACSFRDNFARFQKEGVEIIGVSADSLKSHNKFTDAFGLPFPLLSDETKEMLKAYGVWKQKTFMGRKFLGIERTTFLIDEKGVIRKIFLKVKVDGHIEEILKVL